MRVTNHFLESQPIMRNKNCEKNIYGIFIEYRNDIIPPITNTTVALIKDLIVIL